MEVTSMIKTVFLILTLITAPLYAQLNSEDQVYILTDYLLREKGKDIDKKLKTLTPASPEYKALLTKKRALQTKARNEAIATVYGKPKFKHLVYDDNSEIFFGRIISSNNNFIRDVNFYMPRKRARSFKKNIETGRIEIEHLFKNNTLEFKDIELEYAGVTYPLNIVRPNTFTLKLGGYFIGIQDTNIYTQKNGVGATINLQDLFDMDEKVSVGRVNAVYKFNPKHRIEASWYSISSKSSKSADFIFNDVSIDASADININFDTDIYKINYVYSVYKTSKLEFSFRAGFHITKITTGYNATYNVNQVNESIEQDSIAITAPLPVLGIGLNYAFSPELHLNYTIDYFALSYDSSVSGAMSDSLISLDYNFNRYVGIGGGINRTQMRFKAIDQDTEFGLRDDVAGFIGYLILSY